MDISKIKYHIVHGFQDMSTEHKLIIFLLIISFIVRILFLTYSPVKYWDETVYLNLGYDLSHTPLDYSLENSGWSDYIPSTERPYEWPNIGFRAPLLSYLLAFLYFLGLNILIPFVVPIIATASIYLVYVFGKKLFDGSTGLYAALLFSLLPIHILFSGKTMTDTVVIFFILLSFISFWKGYELQNKKHKILFGIFLAFALLSRYTTLWIAPIFLLYFIVRDKSLTILKDKYLWGAIISFLIILVPWFGYSMSHYGHPLGAFIHGFKGGDYWGGIQSLSYFLENAWQIFSIVGITFAVSLGYIIIKKEYTRRPVYLMLIWVFFFLTMALVMSHKEERFIMPIIPAVCLLSAYCMQKMHRYKHVLVLLVIIILIGSSGKMIVTEYRNSNTKIVTCFREGNEYLKTALNPDRTIVMTAQSSIVYYYTHLPTHFLPAPWDLKQLRYTADTHYGDKDVYIYYTNFESEIAPDFKNDLDTNFTPVFECTYGGEYSEIYKYHLKGGI